MKKVILFGEEGVGKTSIVLTSCLGYDFEQVKSLLPTKGVSIEDLNFRGIVDMRMWDCAGQENYMEKHFSQNKHKIFSSIDAAIFVMDASRKETLSTKYAKTFLHTIREYNPNIDKVYVFINKMDIAVQGIHNYIMDVTNDLLHSWDHGFVEVVMCSVRTGSARYNFVKLLDSVIVEDQVLTKKKDFYIECLTDLQDVADGHVSLFHIPSGLLTATTVEHEDQEVFSDEVEEAAHSEDVVLDMVNLERSRPIKIENITYNKKEVNVALSKLSPNSILLVASKGKIDMEEILDKLKKHDTFKDLKEMFKT